MRLRGGRIGSWPEALGPFRLGAMFVNHGFLPSALIFNGSGLRVATVGPEDKVLFKTVKIARDLGKEIEIASGLTPDDRIIVAPPDGIADGDQVRVAGAKGKPATVSEKQAGKG